MDLAQKECSKCSLAAWIATAARGPDSLKISSNKDRVLRVPWPPPTAYCRLRLTPQSSKKRPLWSE